MDWYSHSVNHMRWDYFKRHIWQWANLSTTLQMTWVMPLHNYKNNRNRRSIQKIVYEFKFKTDFWRTIYMFTDQITEIAMDNSILLSLSQSFLFYLSMQFDVMSNWILINSSYVGYWYSCEGKLPCSTMVRFLPIAEQNWNQQDEILYMPRLFSLTNTLILYDNIQVNITVSSPKLRVYNMNHCNSDALDKTNGIYIFSSHDSQWVPCDGRSRRTDNGHYSLYRLAPIWA